MNNAAFTLIAEHADFVVLDKAAGVSFHSEEGPGLVVQASAALGYPLFAVHRLDKVTSGLIIFARSANAAAALTTLFTEHQIQKYYIALSTGKAQKKQGWVKGDMAPARRGAYKLLGSKLQPAVSYFISQGFSDQAELPTRLRLFLIRPWTGKTHQVRVALKSAAAPIVGDELYQAESSDRVYLHAFALHFVYQGRLWQFCSLPRTGALFLHSEVQTVLRGWSKPWTLPWPAYQQPLNHTPKNDPESSHREI